MGDGRQGVDVVDIALGIADRFGVQQAGRLVDGGLDLFEIPGIHDATLDAETPEGVFEESCGAAVEIGAADDVLPHCGEPGNGVKNGRHTRSGGESAAAAVHGRKTIFEDGDGWIAQARVDVAECLEGKQIGGMGRVPKYVAARLIDGNGPGKGLRVRMMARMQGQGFQVGGFPIHGRHSG